MTEESVTAWIDGLRAGEEIAAAKVWNHFYARLITLAHRTLCSAPRRAADEEDVVLSAFRTFFRRVHDGEFPQLHDSDNLWQVLAVITERKALNQLRDERRQKRGGERGGGGPGTSDEPRPMTGLDMDVFAGPEPTPEFAAAMAESLSQLLAVLDPDLRQTALLKLEGRTNEEIAAVIDRSLATVERRLRLIRRRWSQPPV